MDERTLSRLRWRCRRGMLENDLLLTRFLDAESEQLTDADCVLLTRLLDTPDGDLWDLLSGRSEPEDVSLRPIVQRLRSC